MMRKRRCIRNTLSEKLFVTSLKNVTKFEYRYTKLRCCSSIWCVFILLNLWICWNSVFDFFFPLLSEAIHFYTGINGCFQSVYVEPNLYIQFRTYTYVTLLFKMDMSSRRYLFDAFWKFYIRKKREAFVSVDIELCISLVWWMVNDIHAPYCFQV